MFSGGEKTIVGIVNLQQITLIFSPQGNLPLLYLRRFLAIYVTQFHSPGPPHAALKIAGPCIQLLFNEILFDFKTLSLSDTTGLHSFPILRELPLS